MNQNVSQNGVRKSSVNSNSNFNANGNGNSKCMITLRLAKEEQFMQKWENQYKQRFDRCQENYGKVVREREEIVKERRRDWEIRTEEVRNRKGQLNQEQSDKFQNILKEKLGKI